MAKTIEKSLEHEITKPIEQNVAKEKPKEATREHRKRKACESPENHHCNTDDKRTPKQPHSALGQELFAETFEFTLPKSLDHMEHYMLRCSLIRTARVTGSM